MFIIAGLNLSPKLILLNYLVKHFDFAIKVCYHEYMDKAEILNRFLEELDHSSPETIRTRKFWAEKFLRFAPSDFTKWNKSLVYSFEQKLRDERYAGLTVRTAFGIVKRVFDAARAVHEAERTRLISEVDPNNSSAVAEILQAMQIPGPQWDLGKRAMPRVEISEITKPVLSFDEIEKMVATARDSKLALPEICYLALNSIYGLRRGELCAIRKEHFNFSDNTLFVMTEKGGERRKQLLAEPIIPYLKEYDFGVDYSPFIMTCLFKKICSKSQVEKRDGMGWHALRRALDTILISQFGELKTHVFLRWRLSSSSQMELRYFSADPLQIDDEVLARHPIARLWT